MNIIVKNTHWLIRISLASTFIYHGYPKLGVSVANLGYIGYLVGPFELFGALFLISGGFLHENLTRVGSLLIAIIMIGAIYMHLFKWNDHLSSVEWQFLILANCIFFIIRGNKV